MLGFAVERVDLVERALVERALVERALVERLEDFEELEELRRDEAPAFRREVLLLFFCSANSLLLTRFLD